MAAAHAKEEGSYHGASSRAKLRSSGSRYHSIKGKNSLSSRMAGSGASNRGIILGNMSTTGKQLPQRLINLKLLLKLSSFDSLPLNIATTIPSIWTRLLFFGSLHLIVHLLRKLVVVERRVKIELH